MVDINTFLDLAKKAAEEAAVKILEIYNSDDFDVSLKDDQSPLTKADKASHKVICEILEPLGLPVLSEEGKAISYAERSDWPYFWMVDPIDGTKEFIKRNGEFTVNIALIKKDQPVLGVVQVPATGDIYHAVWSMGAFKNGEKIQVSNKDISSVGLKVVASRSHLNEDTEAFMGSLKDPEIVSKGSSLKLLMVAEGEADIYPRFAPTMEWDTAAAQIIVEEAGGKVLQKNTNQSVVYNKEDLLNPHFLVKGTR
ncbi:MAG: 3'(2'),5'-bisphosphate nucleotidase CysQ [Cytophagales bacterium]|nr:3'(2'),5'-bisphosphate nucleotidase CysQ [Cytophagales bacterium]